MEQTLDTKDIQVLDTGKVFSISSQDSNYAYLGGDFSTNPNDYVEILIYDTNNNFLESSTVDESDYKSNSETGLKTLLTILYLLDIGFARTFIRLLRSLVSPNDGVIWVSRKHHRLF